LLIDLCPHVMRSSLTSFVSFSLLFSILFFFTDTATTEIYTLSLHDALPICLGARELISRPNFHSVTQFTNDMVAIQLSIINTIRSEEHTSELQSRFDLVCRLLLEKKKKEKKDR